MALVLCLPALLADTLTVTSVNPSGAHLGGVYTGPYVGTINGVAGIEIICDDYQTSTSLNTQFYVTETKVSELTGPDPNQVVKFNRDNYAEQQSNYMTAAYLAIQLIGVDQSTAAGRLQASLLNYAIWGIFYADALNSLTTSQKSAAEAYLVDAQSAVSFQTVDKYSSVSIWTPTPNSAAQEFLSVRVPEPSTIGVLAGHAFVLVILGLFLRRRGFRLTD